jgi:LemA protein
MTLPQAIGILVILVLLILVGAAYNRLITRRNRVDSTWSDIDILLRRRHDLVPNLVAAVQGYAVHEAATFRAVTDARVEAQAAHEPSARGEAERTLGGAVNNLLAVAESYPDLKASASFIDLQQRLTSTEDGLAHARQFYNDAVFAYNTAIQSLPTNMVAWPLGFRARQFFQAAGAERQPAIVRN